MARPMRLAPPVTSAMRVTPLPLCSVLSLFTPSALSTVSVLRTQTWRERSPILELDAADHGDTSPCDGRGLVRQQKRNHRRQLRGAHPLADVRSRHVGA